MRRPKHRRRASRKIGFRPRLEVAEDRVLLSIVSRAPAAIVNTSTGGNQLVPVVAMDANGDSIVVWRDASADAVPTYESDIRAQRYSPVGAQVHKDGTTAGAQEFIVHSEADAQFIERNSPAVAMDPAGDFVVAWTRNDTTITGNYLYEIQARVFNSAGTALTGDLNVSVNTHTNRGNPAVAMDSTGNWVITWVDQGTGNDVFAKKFSLNGTAIALNGSTNPLLINSGAVTGSQSAPSVASDSAGDFVVTWTSFDAAQNNGQEVFARRFNSSGVQQGAEIHVNTTTSADQNNSHVAMTAAGDFIITWVNDLNDASPNRGDIFYKRYNADGTLRNNPGNSDLQANATSTGFQQLPSVDIDANGNATIAWNSISNTGGGNLGVFARRINAQGVPIEVSDIPVSTVSGTGQDEAGVGVDNQGDVAVSYRQINGTGPSTNEDIFAHFYKYVNDAPTLASLSDLNIASNAGLQTVNLSGIAAGGGESQDLVVSATSNNTALIPNPSISYTSPNATGTLSFTPVAGQAGVAIITVTVKDNGGTANSGVDTTTRTFKVTVVGAPTANNQSVSVAHNTATPITLTGSDPNSPPLALTYIVTANPSHGTLSGTAPNLTYTPAAGYQGSDSFQFKVNNGSLDSNTATVSLTVAAAAPTANNQSVSVSHDTAKAITLTGSDPNSPALPLTFIVTANPAHGSLSGSAPNLTYTPNPGFQGSDSFQFKVNNGQLDSNTATVSLTIAAAAPTANAQSVTAAEDTAKSITLTGSDPNSPALPLTFIVTANPAHGSLSGTAPNLTYTPAAGYFGPDSFQFKVNNGQLDSNVATVSINVVGKPTANNQSVSVTENTPLGITLTGSDPNAPALPLTYLVTVNPAHGMLSGTAPTLTYTPAANYTGPDSFQFTVSNDTVTSNVATVSISVNAPTAAAVSAFSVDWGTAGVATLTTAGDGLRLLPSGRATDLPWANISKFAITLTQAATLSPADVSVTGINVANYGPVSISGSGTNYTITLAQPIAGADRVTVTIGNAGITTYTRRLDVLPGDFNDDGVVSSQDMVLVANTTTQPYNVFADVDGNGVVDLNDVQIVRRRIGTHLP